MKVISTSIPDLLIIEPKVFRDDRGYFMETFREISFFEHIDIKKFVQDNEAMSHKGVLRGLHYQIGKDTQGKLVRVIKGSVFDVAVDIRLNSPTYGQWYGIELSEANKKMLYVPRGFAHGYLVLEDNTIFSYKCDNYYAPESEGGLSYNDKQIAIRWPNISCPYIISEKDLKWPTLGNHISDEI